MATVTNIGHVNNAIRLTNQISNIYIGLGTGGVDTNETKLNTFLGVRRADTVSLARLIPATETYTGSYVLYGGNKYELVSQANAYIKKANYVYIKTTLAPDELPGKSYDTVALLTSPTFKVGVTGDVVPSASVVNQGFLEMYETREALDRSNLKVTEQFIIEA